MSELDPIVRVDITVESDTVARTTFGVPAVVAQFADASWPADAGFVAYGTARAFYSTAEVSKVFGPDHFITDIAAGVFGQSPRPEKLIIGRKDAATSWADTLDAVNELQSSFYGFTIVPHSTVSLASQDAYNAEILDVAAWTEANGAKIFFAPIVTKDNAYTSVFVGAPTDSLGEQLHALGYRRTVPCYHPESKEKAAKMGISWFSEGAPYKPGKSTYAYKQIAGTTPTNLAPAQRSVLNDRFINYYCTIAGSNVTRRGVVASGEFLDVIIGIDWLHATIQENVYARLVATRKISYDDAGIASTAAIVQSSLEEGGRNGILQLNSIQMTVPKYKDIPLADRNARKLTGIKFTALLEGAVDTAVIEGTVSV